MGPRKEDEEKQTRLDGGGGGSLHEIGQEGCPRAALPYRKII